MFHVNLTLNLTNLNVKIRVAWNLPLTLTKGAPTINFQPAYQILPVNGVKYFFR